MPSANNALKLKLNSRLCPNFWRNFELFLAPPAGRTNITNPWPWHIRIGPSLSSDQKAAASIGRMRETFVEYREAAMCSVLELWFSEVIFHAVCSQSH
jgi:hypothetical protein